MVKSKGFAGVYVNKMKNGDVSYYFTYRDTNDLDSKGRARFKRIKVGTKANGLTEAFTNQKRIETINALKLGDDSPIKYAKRKQFTFKNAFDDYMVWAKANKKTWKRDNDLFSLHLKPLHNRELIKLTKKDFEKIKNEKLITEEILKKKQEGKELTKKEREKLAPRTVEYILAVARQIINHAIDDELVTNYQNPIRKVHGQGKGLMPKYDNQKLAYLTHKQAKQVLEALKEVHAINNQKVKTYHPESYYFSILMLFTGARFDEISHLTWQSIDFDSELIHIEPSKGGLSRKVLITPPIADVLQTLLNTKQSDQSPLIPNSKGKRWERIPKQWQTTIDKLYPDNKKAGKYRITPHTLRHTHASWLAKNGTDILRIKEQLGHKKLDMTLRYAHLIPNQRHDKTRELFDNFQGGK